LLDRQASFAGFMKSISIGDVSSCAPHTRKAQHASCGGVPPPRPERQLRPAPVRERSAPNSAGEGFKPERNQLGNPSRRRHPLQRLMVLYATDFGRMAPKSIGCVGTAFSARKIRHAAVWHASKVVTLHVQNLNRNGPIILVPLSMALRFLGEIDDVLTTSAE
jgi:hypothetical protein